MEASDFLSEETVSVYVGLMKCSARLVNQNCGSVGGQIGTCEDFIVNFQ